MEAAPQVRTGRVSSIDYEHGTYEVVFADRGSVSCTINAASNGEYKMPEIGQMVSCTMNGNGTVAGATLGTVWNATNKPAEGYKGLYRKEYGRVNGDSYERYDANTGEYTQYTRAKTGRNSRGVIYDECGGAYTARCGGAMTLRSTKGSVGITAETGVGVTAREAVSVEAGTYASVNAADALDVACGADCTLTVGGDLNQEITALNAMAANVRAFAGALDKAVKDLEAGDEDAEANLEAALKTIPSSYVSKEMKAIWEGDTTGSPQIPPDLDF